MKKKKICLIVLGRGGHTAQILRLVDRLGNKYAYEYVVGKEDQVSEKQIKYKGKVHRMLNPRLMKHKSLIIVFLRMIPAGFDVFKILLKTKANVVLSAGPSMTIPFFYLAKLFGKKLIFVESWVRIHHKSLTGRFVYPISDLFFVQWASMKKIYKKAVFAGRLG